MFAVFPEVVPTVIIHFALYIQIVSLFTTGLNILIFILIACHSTDSR